jgi:hypothetical protein
MVVAQEEDYKSGDPVGQFLAEKGVLKTVSDLEHEHLRNFRCITNGDWKSFSMASAHVSMRYGFQGPNHAAVTACTAGAHSIGDATRMIQFGAADVMVAGGSESSVDALSITGFSGRRALPTNYNYSPETEGKAVRCYELTQEQALVKIGRSGSPSVSHSRLTFWMHHVSTSGPMIQHVSASGATMQHVLACYYIRLGASRMSRRGECHDPAGVQDYKEPMGRVAGAGGGPSLQRRQYKIGMGERKRGEETRTKHTKPLSTSARSSSILNSVRPLSDSPSLIPIPCCSFSLSLI